MTDNGDTLVVKPSEMEIGREYLMKLGTLLLVALKTPNGNIMFWYVDND